jgi:hypothetical protein
MRSMNGWASAPTGTGAVGVAGRRRVRPIAGAAITAMLVAIGLPLAATSASAAVITPGVIINSFPNRDFVMAQGYTPGTAHTVTVVRAGVIVGTSPGVADHLGFVQVNHPAIAPDVTNCWTTSTPDIRPGDVIQVGADSMITDGINLTQTAAFDVATGIVTLRGTAPALGAPLGRIPLAQLEVRANAKKTQFLKSLKASVRANSIGTLDGSLSYDTPTGDAWTAIFTGMGGINPAEADQLTDGQRAVNADSVALSLATPQEITNSEKGLLIANGPSIGVGGCNASPAQIGPSRPIMTPGTSDTGVLGDFITKNPTPTFTGSIGMLDSTSVSLFVDNLPVGSTSAIGAGGAYSITPTTALTAGTVHNITVGETGPTAGAMLMSSEFSLVTIDMTSPTVTGNFPANTAKSTTMVGNVTATFNEALDPSTVTPVNFTLKNAAGTAVPATATFNKVTKAITFDPFASLVVGTTYTATLTAGITDAAGNPLVAQSWSFTTATSLVASYINRVYLDLFTRSPDPIGLAGWTAKLNTGTPRVAVANAITGSPEYRSTLITASYLKYLGRTPDPAGLTGWLAAMNRGYTVSRMEAGFIASPEYYANAGGTDATWVVKLYSDVLGRAASPSEVNHWTTSLSAGATRNQVAMGFLLSTERLSTVVNGYYQKLLGRGLDPTGLVTWVKKLQAGAKNETIIGGIIASPEYFSHS